MDLEEALGCLAEADAGQRRSELCGGRYVPVLYTGTDDDEDEGIYELNEESSLYDALDSLAAAIVQGSSLSVGELLEQVTLAGEIRSPERRILGYLLSGGFGAMDIVTARHAEDCYLGDVPAQYPGARFVLLASAAPPHHELACGVLELQPVGDPGRADLVLFQACRSGDWAEFARSLDAGARINILDERGMSPLHVAVANRRDAVVAAALAAGADPRCQSGYGNAPQFAALDDAQQVMPCAQNIDGDAHLRILHMLIDAGAPLDARDTSDATLLDIVISTRPYPSETVRELVGKGARSSRLEGCTLGRLLTPLPYYSHRQLEIRVNQVRFLLDSGADPNASAQPAPRTVVLSHEQPALHALLRLYGYYEHEVPGEVLVELVDELLRHGARDVRYDGITALACVQDRVKRGFANYQPVAERLLTIAPTQSS